MKDLPLSLLSRGCGRFISVDGTTGRDYGRLDVCFTPQDYYIWKSRDFLMRLSDNGCLLGGDKPTLPTTYSTRRGPLLLYSQDFVTLGSRCASQPGDRKKRVPSRYAPEVQHQPGITERYTTVVHCSNKPLTSRRVPTLLPPLHHPPPPKLHCPNISPHRATVDRLDLAQMNPQRLPAERNTELGTLHEDKNEKQGNRRRVRLELFLQIPGVSRTPTPQVDPQPCVQHVTPEASEEPQTDVHPQHTEIRDIRHRKINFVHNEVHDRGCSFRRDNDDRSASGSRHRRTVRSRGAEQQVQTNTTPGGHSARRGSCRENTDRVRWEGPSSDEGSVQRLPPIGASFNVAGRQVIQAQTQQDVQTEAGQVQSQHHQNQIHQQPLLLPRLLPLKKDEERTCKKSGRREQTGRQRCKQETLRSGGGREGGRRPSKKGPVLLLEPGEEPPLPVGVLGCVAGRRGPGRQSSLAFLQNRQPNLQDSCDSGDANRGVVRGVLPLELRDLQNDRAAGSLILGPDGEVIHLSLYDKGQDPSQDEQALQVLSAEGEKLPWVIVLQPEHTNTEGRVELHMDDPAGDLQSCQSINKDSDLHRSVEPDVRSSSSRVDPVAETKNKTKSAEAAEETWKDPKRDDNNSIRMSPPREGAKEPRGGSAEEEEEKEKEKEEEEEEKEKEEEEEQQASTEQTDQLLGSQWPQSEKPSCTGSVSSSQLNEATAEEAEEEEERRKDTERKDTDLAAVTSGKMESKLVDGQADGRQEVKKKRDGKWRRQKGGSEAQTIPKQEDLTKREAAETLDQSALSSTKQHRREGGGGQVKKREGRGEAVRQKDDSSTGKRRRARLKPKDSVVGTHEDGLEKEEVELHQEKEEEVELHQEKEEDSLAKLKLKASRSTEGNTGRLSADVQRSSLQSESSLRSPAPSQLHQRSSREESVPASVGLTSSQGRLSSSCSTVMITEEQLMLNPVNRESSRVRRREEEEEEAAALRLAQRAERRRQEVERKRKEREEEERKQQEREQMEERMRGELEEERRKRTEELRLKRLVEEEERRRYEEEKQEGARWEQAEKERERRRQEERRRQMEQLQRMREEEEQRRRVQLEGLRLEEERRQEEECKRLQEMDESERMEYLRRKEHEEEDRRTKEDERKRGEEEAALLAAEESRLQAELLARQMTLLQQQLAFKRGLLLEAGGLEHTQGLSRPWIYSYFTLLQLLGLNQAKVETATPEP